MYNISSEYVKTIHNHEPDFEKTLFKIPEVAYNKILDRLSLIYGRDVAEAYIPEFERVMQVYYAHKPDIMIEREKKFNAYDRFTEKDVILITYGDLLRGEESSPIDTLARFCDMYLEGTINTLHILPFFPYTSDRGFSITDFSTVDPKLGTWQDIEDLENRYQLMFDGVINHISSKSRWFQEFLNGAPYYRDFFIVYNRPEDLKVEDRKKLFRPRTSDVLHKYFTYNGAKYVWTTFSRDQIDLNYKNPNVLVRVLEILLLYVRHGADIIRLDAVTYLWVEPGTRSIHLEQTHEIVKLLRDVLDTVAPGVALITETNVPHEENISYFGSGSDEAHMVYNFALPPLTLYTFYKGDATELSKWASGLERISDTSTFFNFLDSHDGIGLMGVKNILPKGEIDFLIKNAEEHGGLISYKTGDDGTEEPYEINITWFSALNSDEDREDVAFQVKRFAASRMIAMIIQGVPGIYLHSLIGTKNDIDAVISTKSKRDINRTVIDKKAVDEALSDPFSKFSRINRELGRLIKMRTRLRAFHPNGDQKVLYIASEIFSVLRISPEKDQHIIAMINVTANTCHLQIDLKDIDVPEKCKYDEYWFDIVSEEEYMTSGSILRITLQPYDIVWLQPDCEMKVNS
ncbi:MAG: sugar phosphorylase [Spirochaetes bacterium]|nr:sugar phosphorylase [Spirochaetota bacterium]